MRLSAANGSGLNIIGALFVNISGESSLGEFFQTKQLCYVADGVDKMLLSRGACEKLGIINKKFPAVGFADNGKSESIAVNNVTHSPGGNLQYASFTLQQRFLPFFYVKSSSNLKPNDSFEICSS